MTLLQSVKLENIGQVKPLSLLKTEQHNHDAQCFKITKNVSFWLIFVIVYVRFCDFFFERLLALLVLRLFERFSNTVRKMNEFINSLVLKDLCRMI